MFDSLSDIEFELCESIETLIEADLNAPTLLEKIKELVKQRNQIYKELNILDVREGKA